MNKLKMAREEKNLTQKQIAEKANISFRAYQNYESGKQIPSVCAALDISKVLASTVEKLFGK